MRAKDIQTHTRRLPYASGAPPTEAYSTTSLVYISSFIRYRCWRLLGWKHWTTSHISCDTLWSSCQQLHQLQIFGYPRDKFFVRAKTKFLNISVMSWFLVFSIWSFLTLFVRDGTRLQMLVLPVAPLGSFQGYKKKKLCLWNINCTTCSISASMLYPWGYPTSYFRVDHAQRAWS